MPKKLKVFLAIFLLCLCAAGGMSMLSQSQVSSKLDAIRANGFPTTGAESNDYYKVPAEHLDTTTDWMTAINMIATASSTPTAQELPIIGRGDKPPVPGVEWQQLSESREFLTTIEAELAATSEAAAKGGYVRFPIDLSMGLNTLLDDTQELRSVARVFQLDAYVSAHDGNYDRAHKDICGMLAASETLHFEPTIISQLVRVAIYSMAIHTLEQILPGSEWSDAQLAELQTRLTAADLKSGFKRSLIGERAITVDEINRFSAGPFRSSNKIEALDFYDALIDSMDGSWADSMSTVKELDQKISGLNSSVVGKIKYRAVLQLIPAIGQVTTAGARGEAKGRCACIALAIRRFELQQGTELESMDQLSAEFFALDVDKLLSDIMTDPFDDLPIKTKGFTDHIAIYSIGMDFVDGQGDLGDKDGSSRPLDTGFRLYRRSLADDK